MIAALLTLSALLLVAIFGPRPRVDTALPPIDLPESLKDLEAWIREREASVENLRPGTERCLRWLDPENPARTSIGIIYLHGFTATRQESAPLCDDLARGLGANLFYARLSGHGRCADALGAVDVADWLRDGQEAIEVGRRIGEKLIIVAASTGATLAAWLATLDQNREAITAMVFLSPNFGPRDGRASILTWPWGGTLVRALIGPYRQIKPRNELHERFWTTRYASRALITMQALVDLALGAQLAKVKAPTLALFDPDDEVVAAELIAPAIRRFGGHVELEPFYGSGDPHHHILVGEHISPASLGPLNERISRFVRERLDASAERPRASPVRKAVRQAVRRAAQILKATRNLTRRRHWLPRPGIDSFLLEPRPPVFSADSTTPRPDPTTPRAPTSVESAGAQPVPREPLSEDRW